MFSIKNGKVVIDGFDVHLSELVYTSDGSDNLDPARTLPGIITGEMRVEWVNIGEGRDGDFDPNDPDDVNLLRFDASHWELCDNCESAMTGGAPNADLSKCSMCGGDGGEWIGDDGSYCTMVPASTSDDRLVELLKVIANGVSSSNFKKDCESMSWIGQDFPKMVIVNDDDESVQAVWDAAKHRTGVVLVFKAGVRPERAFEMLSPIAGKLDLYKGRLCVHVFDGTIGSPVWYIP